MLSSSVYLPFPVERRISLWAELSRFVGLFFSFLQYNIKFYPFPFPAILWLGMLVLWKHTATSSAQVL